MNHGKAWRRGLLAALALLALAAAGQGCGAPDPERQAQEAERQARQQEEAREKAAAKLDGGYVQASNRFGLQLYRQLAEERPDGNLLLSPWSVGEALGMAWQGSRGETAEEIRQAGGWAAFSPQEAARQAGGWRSYLELPSDGARLSVANSLWVQQGREPMPSYRKTLEANYGAELEMADFAGGGAEAAERMNRWVDRHTEGMIPQIVDPNEPLDPETLAVLLNTVYFKGGWQDEFDPARTEQAAFAMDGGEPLDVAMMQRGGSYPYLRTERFEAVRLPYGLKGGYRLLLVLPARGLGVDDLLPDLERYEEWQGELQAKAGSVALPRFKAAVRSVLNEPLRQLGMRQAFAPGADFGGMLEGSPDLHLSLVLHQVVLEVNEKGTEAVAATLMAEGGSAPPSDPFEFRADRPFFLAIEDGVSGAWLFLGRIGRPADGA